MEIELLRQNAIAKRDAALAEAKRWDEFLHMLDEAARGLTAMGGGTVMVHFPSSVERRNPTPRGAGRMTETESAASEIIRANDGKPVQTADMLKELEKRGIVVGGKDPSSTLSARLSRAESLENVRPYGWRLKEPRQTNEAAAPGQNGGAAASGSTAPPVGEVGPMPAPAPSVEPGGGGGA